MLDEGGHDAELEIDGGIKPETAPDAARAGARVLVSGSAVFNDRESVAAAIAKLREERGVGRALAPAAIEMSR